MGAQCSCDCGDKRDELEYNELKKNIENNQRLSEQLNKELAMQKKQQLLGNKAGRNTENIISQ